MHPYMPEGSKYPILGGAFRWGLHLLRQRYSKPGAFERDMRAAARGTDRAVARGRRGIAAAREAGRQVVSSTTEHASRSWSLTRGIARAARRRYFGRGS